MNKIQLEEIVDFRNVISMLNSELYSKGIFDIEYMLINNSISDVISVLNDNSYYYALIKDDKYSNGATFEELIGVYLQFVKQKYNSLLIPDGKNDKIADKYYNKLKEPTRSNGTYLQYPKSSIGMIQQDVEKTLMLMREAILAYYKVYHDIKLVAELTTNSPDNSDYLEFTIKEEQLLHLLGVTANQLRTNPDFIRLTGNNHMNSVEILEWIVRDLDGNNDLLQYSEDFLKRIVNGSFELVNNQFGNDTQSRLLNYHKIRAKSQAFLKYGPFEKVSLVAKLQNGKKLAVNSNSNTAMISRAECFRKYPWAYFGSVQNQSDKYIETLIIDSASGKKELFKGSTPAIVKGVYRMGEEGGGTGGGGSHVFSEEEQFSLFCMSYEAFQDTMDFKNLKEYFSQLGEETDFIVPDHPGIRR
ncbi:MAG: hypothetical protein E7167_06195 [Firmicutes bacterium]|nr:hypothetical protein [Bacillota bacterium]